MKQKNLHQPFELYVSDLGDLEERILVYHFFEIVQILDGEGVREVNENHFPYRTGDIFLFTPLDCRGFKSNTPTRFCSIRFSEVFLTGYKNVAERHTVSSWLKQLEQLFYQHNRFEQFVIRDETDRAMVTGLIANLVQEFDRKQAYFEDNIQHLITLMLNTLARNISVSTAKRPASQEEEPLINKMLLHIKEHIHAKDKLTISYLAGAFHLSSNYVGEYFKKMTGESLQRYVTVYKMRLVEYKLLYSQSTISQIAEELGFTDESHLSTQFKKYAGVSPAAFRKAKAA
ncbi:AraC family transcriptional regulator [Paraflavitalea sp. CAU 1676]|uniref:helix-turn-helix domain-containing protein n=1 Tax=Paraflavitalea sp. CAU 1676 TaxID=3032598 RepID=UPI0023DC37D8|nr:AraC family transcriptional regulator [Paraflavitalea sp. CAU 1676]MDF2193761.1 AraC family transcriptional regulator [Paraflavitalea sp. CAU 1676]